MTVVRVPKEDASALAEISHITGEVRQKQDWSNNRFSFRGIHFFTLNKRPLKGRRSTTHLASYLMLAVITQAFHGNPVLSSMGLEREARQVFQLLARSTLAEASDDSQNFLAKGRGAAVWSLHDSTQASAGCKRLLVLLASD